jgi:uncharacterized LabA/DUF88 family protein
VGGLHGRPFLFLANGHPPTPARVIVYIDGFNFFYGTVDGTPYKWLDLQKVATRLRNDENVVLVRYFTSLVKGRASAERQMAYVQALASLPLVRVKLGSFKHEDVTCRHDGCTFAGSREFKKLSEKRTDVGIGVAMVDDAHRDRCDHAILISGDSDLVPAVQMVRNSYPQKRVTVYVPVHENASDREARRADELRQVANAAKPFPFALLKVCQFPDVVTLAGGGTVRKPATW